MLIIYMSRLLTVCRRGTSTSGLQVCSSRLCTFISLRSPSNVQRSSSSLVHASPLHLELVEQTSEFVSLSPDCSSHTSLQSRAGPGALFWHTYGNYYEIIIRGHPSKTSSPIGRGGFGYIPDVHKWKKIGVSESVSETNTRTPTSRSWESRLQYILRFGRFYARYGPDVFGRGGGGCPSPKSQFLLGRLWWMTPNMKLYFEGAWM